LTDIANPGQRLCLTQEENDPSITRHRLDLHGTQAALVNAASLPQFTQFDVFMRQLNGKLDKVLMMCHQKPTWHPVNRTYRHIDQSMGVRRPALQLARVQV
jgi:hypothetical protein